MGKLNFYWVFTLNLKYVKIKENKENKENKDNRENKENKVTKINNSFELKGAKSMDLARMSSNGQVVVPIEIRRKLDLKAGDKILFIEKNGQVVIQNANKIFKEDDNRNLIKR